MEPCWTREDPLNLSMAAGEMATSVTSIVRPLSGDNATAKDVLAVLMLSAQIDGWNFRRALADAEDIANAVLSRATKPTGADAT